MAVDLAAQLAQAITLTQQEIARIADDASAKTAAQTTRLTALQTAQAALTPEIQTILANLQAVGVTITFAN